MRKCKIGIVGFGTVGSGIYKILSSEVDSHPILKEIEIVKIAVKDINKNGIEPDIRVDLLLNDKNRLTNSDLGTLKDSQYVAAENILLKKFKIESNKNSYNPLKSNLGYALKN